MKAKQQPDKYLSIVIDDIDQSMTFIMYFPLLSSFAAEMWKLQTHLNEAIIHGIGIYGYFDFYQYPYGSNLTIHVLLTGTATTVAFTETHIPPVLYLQLDHRGEKHKPDNS